MKEKDENEMLFDIVELLSRDYEWRKCVIKEKRMTPRVRTEYAYINAKLYSASQDIVGPQYADIFIHEIGNKIGFAKSRVDCMSEGTYKLYKTRIKLNMLRKLYLLD